jgi:hypothetical protein
VKLLALAQEFAVDSSSANKKYRVRCFLPDEPATCDCVAFAIARNRAGGKNHGGTAVCKHIRQVMKDVCPWTDGFGVAQTIEGVCPECGGETVDTEAKALPELPRLAVDAVTEKLLAMQADLEGRGVKADDMDVPSTGVEVPSDDPGVLAADLLSHVKR